MAGRIAQTRAMSTEQRTHSFSIRLRSGGAPQAFDTYSSMLRNFGVAGETFGVGGGVGVGGSSILALTCCTQV